MQTPPFARALTLGIFTVVALVAAPGAALAASMCNAPLSVSDVTFEGANSDDCYGVVTNPQTPFVGGPSPDGWTVNTLNGGLFGGDWEALVKDDGPAGTLNGYLGIDWTLSAPQQTIQENWILTLVDPAPSSLPLAVDMLVLLKASDRWAAYLFDDVTFDFAQAYDGTFRIAFQKNGDFPALSNFNVYLRPGTLTVPEPGTLTLGAFGVLLVAALAVWHSGKNREHSAARNL